MIFKTKPYPHQLAAWKQSKDREFFALFMMYGTGKSKVLIDTAAHLFTEKKIDGVLVVAPKGVYRNWSEKEIPEHLCDDIRRTIGWYDASGGRASRDSVTIALNRGSSGLRFLVINIEAISSEKGLKTCKEFLGSGRMLMCIDESTCIKNPQAKRTKIAVRLGRLANYRRILTGDPYANSPVDIYSQLEFLDKNALGFPSFLAFRARFAKLAPVPGAPKWILRVVGFRDLEALKDLVAPHAFLADKEILGLPPKIYLPVRNVEMLPAQRKAYSDMKQYSLAEIGKALDPEPSPGDYDDWDSSQEAPKSGLPTATASIVLTQLLRLQQIACGFVMTEDKVEVDLCDGKNPRVAEVMAAIEEMGPGKKIIIWAPFKHSIAELYAALSAAYGPESVVQYTGNTNADDREHAKIAFQDLKSPVLFFLGNQSTAGRGITLTAADYVIYYANLFDAEIRGNSEDRPHRIGLDHSVGYLDVVAAPVDTKVRTALLTKQSVSGTLRDGSWKEFFE